LKVQKGKFAKALKELAASADPRPLLIEHLGFNHAQQESIDTARWPDEWAEPVVDARFVAEKAGFRVASVLVSDTTPSKTWRAIARRILIDYNGLALVAIHSRIGVRWLWSSASLEHLQTASSLAEGIRHITINVAPDGSVPQSFIGLLGEIDVGGSESDLDVLAKVSGAFDRYAITLQANIGKNAFEALRLLSEGLLSRSSNGLRRDIQTLERIRSEVFIILYRFLFVLYAEDREIFPVTHPTYFDRYSLSWWRGSVTLPFEKDGEAALRGVGGARGTALWQRCRDLFHLIMTGSVLQGHNPDEFNFRAYYGTIFDTELHQNLERWEIPNERVAEAVRALTRSRDESGSTFFVDYSSLEVQHLGAIYERLLEYHLTIGKDGSVEHTLNELERKSTGSYFTPTLLTSRLVTNTLDPILGRIRIQVGDKDPDGFERAVYSLRICDPAMGSGHFLVSVLDHLTRAILEYRHRAGVTQGAEDEGVEIKRTLVRRVVYGVDRNELAVELAKMSLWLETANSERPLSFLDAHLKTGNSLVGAWFRSLADPQRSVFGTDIQDHLKTEVRELVAIERQEEMVAVDVQQKVRQYRKLRSSDTRYGRLEQLLNTQIVAYFGDPVEDWRSARELLTNPRAFDEFVAKSNWEKAARTARRIGFFHWELEFPEAFYSEDGEPKPGGGFDAIVGNPPWDKIKVLDREFFRYRAPEIANAQTAADRKRQLERLAREVSPLWREYEMATKDSAYLGDYLRESRQFVLSAKGDINYYPLFVERALTVTSTGGYVGMVTPTGLVTDYTNREILSSLLKTGQLRRAEDFENKGLFPDVDDRFKFSLILISKMGSRDPVRLVFYLRDPSEADDPSRWFNLPAADVQLFNPNTGSVPLFRSRKDAEINRKMYQVASGVFVDETKGDGGNPWQVRFCGMFHMTNDSRHFRTRAQLESRTWRMAGNWYVRSEEAMVPLFEAKMVHLWNPRFATYHDATEDDIRKGFCRDATLAELGDPRWEPLPRYWIAYKTVREYWERVNWGHGWAIVFRDVARATDARTMIAAMAPAAGTTKPWTVVFRDITNATNERTLIATFAPTVAYGNQAPGLLSSRPIREIAALVANLSSIPFDYCARQKVAGTHMNFFILQQLPVFNPGFYRYWEFDGQPLLEPLSELALELTCTSNLLRPLAEEAGFRAGVVEWNEDRRFELMRKIDAIFAHLYGLSRDEFSHILDTFPIVRENDIQQFGLHRTKAAALRAFEDLTGRLVKVG
jgi:hypothetical protein